MNKKSKSITTAAKILKLKKEFNELDERIKLLISKIVVDEL